MYATPPHRHRCLLGLSPYRPVHQHRHRERKEERKRWERFVRQVPSHPGMRDLISRRHRGRRVVCGITIDPGTSWHARLTDYDHACRNSATVRAIPHGAKVKERLPMSGGAQCHYDQREHFESCVERLGPVDPMCPEATPP